MSNEVEVSQLPCVIKSKDQTKASLREAALFTRANTFTHTLTHTHAHTHAHTHEYSSNYSVELTCTFKATLSLTLINNTCKDTQLPANTHLHTHTHTHTRTHTNGRQQKEVIGFVKCCVTWSVRQSQSQVTCETSLIFTVFLLVLDIEFNVLKGGNSLIIVHVFITIPLIS